MSNDFEKKVKIPPTLIIGLGGTGCDIVSRVYKLSNDNQREYIRCVFFDTDANELRDRKEEANQAFTVQTSKRMTVGQALRNDREARDNSFPASAQLLKKPLTEGAGQVRAVSKLAFDACVREGRLAPLHEAINQLQYLHGDTLEQTMRVIIVTTLVGGTGSGILLPVAMYLRDYLENVCQTKPLVRGICVLPDVFFHGSNKPETEKNNLRTNAYAALRELDAFMQKSENPEAFSNFSLLLPTPGTADDYDEYAENPMDFCFLYDGLNMDGNGLQNLEAYKRHISECIYASSISILNKRLNSSEDNTILARCGEGGRNRYCGIGSSKMVYPFKEVRDYIAMGWMSQAMTEDWLYYDKKFEKQLQNQQASRKRGVILPPLDRREYYCETVNEGYRQENPFATAIYTQCHVMNPDGISYGAPKWEAYYKKLWNFISDRVDSDADYDHGTEAMILEAFGFIRQDMEKHTDVRKNFTTLFEHLKKYYSQTKQRAESKANIIADELLAMDNFNTSLDYHIEHWLTDGGEYLHPNAVRYFLYGLEIMLKKLKDCLMSSGTFTKLIPDDDGKYGMRLSFASLESNVKNFFDNKKYEPKERVGGGKKAVGSRDDEEVESVTIEEFTQGLDLKTFFDTDGGVPRIEWDDGVETVYDDCYKQYKHIKAYYAAYLEMAIIQKAIVQIRKISDNYEYFYQQLDVEIGRLPRSMERITDSFHNNNGDPRMFVCASKKCIEGLSEKCPNTVDSITLTSDFRNAIFNSVYKVIDLNNLEKNAAVINDFVTTNILEFWREQVVEQYGKKVDMDIIDALCVQAEIEEGKFSEKDKIYYVQSKYEEAMKLAAPFIDNPIGEEPYMIYGYAIGQEVAETEDMQKLAVLNRVFSENNIDPLMDKYQILFMKALYNLRLSKLPKFAPADDMWVDPHDDGSYFKQYWDRINKVIPDDKLTKTLTPHLDKRWHYAGIMPDISEKSEQMCLRDAHRALFISVAYGRVEFDRDQYRFKDENGDYLSNNIVVGDGKCNRFSEIYEAMLMSRPLVREQLDHYENAVCRESNAPSCKIDHTSTELYRKLASARIRLGAGIDLENVSFLELPILCKATAGNKRRSDDEAVIMARNMLDFIDDYLKQFYGDTLDRTPFFVEWMREQVVLMCSNLREKYAGKIIAKPFEDQLVKRIRLVLENKIEECRMSCPSGDCSVDRFFADLDAAFAE